MMNCPSCNSENVIKNGSIHNGKQFLQRMSSSICLRTKKHDIPRKEKIPLAGIARVVDISERCLQNYVNI